jgi:4-hydroxybenzoate polyprenyltransferase
VFVLLFAHTLQGGRLNDPLPWALSLPLFFSILPSITLSGIPDYDADRAAGKRTLAVILGPRGAVRFAQTVSIVPALTVIALQFAGPAAELFRWLTPFVLSHAAWLVVRLERYLGQRRPPGRIDGLMTLSLLYILWFVGIPLWRL